MNIHNYNVGHLLVRMLNNPDVSRQEIIDFILKCELVSPEKVEEFLENVQNNNKLFTDNDQTFIEPEDPEFEGILPLDYDN